MPNSYVTSAEIKGKYIVLSVNVDAFAPGEYVEVSGCATQTSYDTKGNGGFATFSEIQEIKKPSSGKPAKLRVRAKLAREFKDGPDITVVVRVAKVWITVLSQGVASIEKDGSRPPWASVEGVGGPDDYSSAQANDGQAVGAVPSVQVK